MADDLVFIDDELQAIEIARDPVVPRPAFAQWLFERRIEDKGAAERLGCTRQTIFYINLPFADPRRTKPGKSLARKIARLTGGDCPPASFDPPTSPEARS